MTMIQPSTDELLGFADVSSVLADGRRPVARLYAADLYRDIHKGIRAELFAVTSTAGNLDPQDDRGRVALTAHLGAVAEVLTTHAEHEDHHVDPALRAVAPELADQVTAEHEQLDATFALALQVGEGMVHAETHERRGQLQLLHLLLSGFTSAYLRHQLVEEWVIMPKLADALGPEAVLGIHGAIVASIPPPEMAKSLAFMLPAMNADDRAELLGGIRAAAPPEAFGQVLDLARSVLEPAEHRATLSRLGL